MASLLAVTMVITGGHSEAASRRHAVASILRVAVLQRTVGQHLNPPAAVPQAQHELRSCRSMLFLCESM